MSQLTEYIVVGSGPTGAMAAQTLVEAGKQVTMLDVGETHQHTYPIPEKDFISIRRTETDQYQYFIGKDLEGVAWGKVGKGEQVTPPRKHMMQGVERLLPVISDQFSSFESLGYGGLGIGWGIGCWEWSPGELKAAGLQPKAMESAYNEVGQRIGVSATKDEAADYTIRSLEGYQPSADMDRNHRLLYRKYQQSYLKQAGFVMGRAPLALLTQDLGSRKKYSYKELDFYSDDEQSAYRPWMTIDQLKTRPNFTYIPRRLVVSFKEDDQSTIVRCLNTATGKHTIYRCRKLILASGILGTARIVLRSQQANDVRLPLLCNPYSYVPCIQPALVGKEAERHKLGFAQLSFFLDEDGQNLNASMASLYSYQSLMMFRMIRQVPLNFNDARLLLRYLLSGMIIMGIHHPDAPSSDKYLQLEKDAASPTQDALYVAYQSSQAEQTMRVTREKKYIKAMRSLGAYPLKRIDPGMGASIHYAGALPFSDVAKPFTLSPQGQLHGTSNVYVADGSGFTFLPAKGLTFTLMANAHRITKGLLT